jgi:hypothetical protein
VIPEYTAETRAKLAGQGHPAIQHFREAAIRARRAGTCHLCANRISTGEVIVQLGKRGSWVHLACLEHELQDLLRASDQFE